MSDTIFSTEIRDTNTYEYSNDSGAVAGLQLFHIVNDLDAEITVTFYGTRQEDSDFSDKEQVGSLTIAADGSGYETMSDPWEEIQLSVVASTAPSNGSVQAYEMN